MSNSGGQELYEVDICPVWKKLEFIRVLPEVDKHIILMEVRRMDYKEFYGVTDFMTTIKDKTFIKKCPICGNSEMHIFRIEILMGDKGIIVRRDDDIQIVSVENNSSRGTTIRMYFSCENAEDTFHGFIQEERFHKGSVLTTLIPVFVNNENWFKDVWRD